MLLLLSDQRRRKLLRYLNDQGDRAVAIDELVAVLTDVDPQEWGDHPEAGRRERIELVHRHLPKLVESGSVEYDPRTATVRYRSDENLEALLEFISELT
jgi:hypothetical protein